VKFGIHNLYAYLKVTLNLKIDKYITNELKNSNGCITMLIKKKLKHIDAYFLLSF
jgi:hypothetical protein